jgi:hypothetical protein
MRTERVRGLTLPDSRTVFETQSYAPETRD